MSGLKLLLALVFLSASCLADPLLGDFVAPLPIRQKKLPPTANYRLPKYFAPWHYKLTMIPDLHNNTFSGEVTIKLDVKQNSNVLILHSLNFNITIENVTVTHQNKDNENKRDPVKVILTELNYQRETLEIVVEKHLTKDMENIELNIKFNKSFEYSLHGFYKSSYMDDKGVEKWLATTHFEPTGARLAFPCWDEPEYKATFEITLKHDKKYTALSNMPLSRETTAADGKLESLFQVTPKMSTYLIAFVICEYKFVYSNTSKFMHRVFTKPHALKQVEFALKTGEKVLKHLDDYTGIDYMENIRKMDQISIPNISAGAMENWGLVTYNENSFLYDEKVTTTLKKQNIALIIAHEFTHQWFGNLVTPEWWKYIWLNEGFANYFQFLIIDKIEPTWRLMDFLVVDSLQKTAFVLDGTLITRPMNEDAQHPSDIMGLFDSIAYQKSGSIIRMISHILTEPVFQRGLRKYFDKYEHSTVNSDKLFESFQEAWEDAPKDATVTKIMDGWVNQPGYPLITVKRKGTELDLKQERFLNKNTTIYIPDKKELYWVPISYYTQDKPISNETKPDIWFHTESMTLKNFPENKWYILNTQQAGYYRVNYDDKNWELLIKALKENDFHKIHVLNRAQLIDDAFNLAKARRLAYNTVFSLQTYLKRESDFIPWVPAYRSLSFLDNLLKDSPQYHIFKTFIRYSMGEVVKTVHFYTNEKDDHVKKMHRPYVIKWACKANMRECTESVQEKFSAWLENPEKNALDIDLKDEILCAALRIADEKSWNATFDIYKASKNRNEQMILLKALGCSESEKILKAYFALALDPSEIGTEKFNFILQNVVESSSIGLHLGMKVFLDNYDKLVELTRRPANVGKCLEIIGKSVRTQDGFSKLAHSISLDSIDTNLFITAMRQAQENLNWLVLYQYKIDKWLISNEEMLNSAGATSLAAFLVAISLILTRFY